MTWAVGLTKPVELSLHRRHQNSELLYGGDRGAADG